MPCLHAGCVRGRASSGGIPQATKPIVDLKQKKETEKQRGTVGPLVDWERRDHRQNSARKRDWQLSTIAIVAALIWSWTTDSILFRIPSRRAEQNQS